MANIFLKEKAQNLRTLKGWSFKEISDFLKCSKSTVAFWCKDIPLSTSQMERLVKKQKESGIKGSCEYSEKMRKIRVQKRLLNQKKGIEDVGVVSRRDLYITGLSLYWAEGYKKGNEEVGFTNSNPEMIKIMIRWFERFFSISKNDFILRVSINKIHRKRESKILNFWSKFTDIPLKQFTKTSFIKAKAKKVYANNNEYFGVLRLKVRKGADLKNRILSSIEFLSKS